MKSKKTFVWFLFKFIDIMINSFKFDIFFISLKEDKFELRFYLIFYWNMKRVGNARFIYINNTSLAIKIYDYIYLLTLCYISDKLLCIYLVLSKYLESLDIFSHPSHYSYTRIFALFKNTSILRSNSLYLLSLYLMLSPFS